jgi:hypothetical protein
MFPTGAIGPAKLLERETGYNFRDRRRNLMPDWNAKKYRGVLNAAALSSAWTSSWGWAWASAVFAAVLSFGFAAIAQDAGVAQTPAENGPGLVIEPAELPTTYPRGPYHVIFHARGNYVPPLHWTLGSGTLPPGITLDDSGSLRGEAQKPGEFQFVVVAKDGNSPQQAVQRPYTLRVIDAITVAWKVPAHVNANRIEGSLEISNTTPEDMDLTFDVKAVAENGRATEIGYQHFPLRKGTLGMSLPFGETLPNGAYEIYANVVGEVPARNVIYKQELKTPKALQVNVAP